MYISTSLWYRRLACGRYDLTDVWLAAIINAALRDTVSAVKVQF